MKIGFTGAQKGMTSLQKMRFNEILLPFKLNAFRPLTEFHHGDCIGADEEAHNQVRACFPKTTIHIHPPKNSKKRAYSSRNEIYYYRDRQFSIPNIHLPKSYLERNKDIVNKTDLLIACPKSNKEELRSGTWATVRCAKKQKKQIIIIFPNGKMR
jgi:hypothetical protein|tara:strand:- start:9684 stop:10148 length:465 start_codon:yes stop_codon:yes gene_type:complete